MRRIMRVAAVATIVVVSAATSAYALPERSAAGTTAAATTALHGPKAKPPPPAGSAAAKTGGVGTAATAQYFYAQASQITTNGGGFAWFDVARPTLFTTDAHTLAELAVSSADGRQIVEVGWTIDRAVFGDADPHLFVYHWVDGQPSCYNGCGFVATGAGGGPVGRKLTPGTAQYLTIRQSSSGWWISADGVGWVGYFPHSLWGGRFTQAGIVQWFGEVAAYSATPCTDMGNGAFGSAATATRIYNIGLWDTTATPNINTGHTHPSYYTGSRVNARELRYGGPGAC